MVIVLSSAGLATSRPISPLRPTAVTGGVCTAKALLCQTRARSRTSPLSAPAAAAATGGEGKEAGVRVSVLYETRTCSSWPRTINSHYWNTPSAADNRVRAPPWPEPQSPEPAPAGRPLSTAGLARVALTPARNTAASVV